MPVAGTSFGTRDAEPYVALCVVASPHNFKKQHGTKFWTTALTVIPFSLMLLHGLMTVAGVRKARLCRGSAGCQRLCIPMYMFRYKAACNSDLTPFLESDAASA